ncbi:hypothetical protein Bca52824_015926 [Brassica carinata]|uniref:Protein kinase domain-containing protein n=1 Tax=Brassica carinata TaxID=52824 RepID=A0A8X7W2Q5_BRACI|nr:hypothetical protein Bca52824_015926 [Brassica carinata]
MGLGVDNPAKVWQSDLRKPAVTSLESNLNENVNRKVQSLVGSTLTSHDMEWDTTNQAEASNVGASTRSKHQNLQSVDSEASLKYEYKASSSSAKMQGQVGEFGNFLNQPASQYSAMGSSCATTTAIRSTSVPMLNATTQISLCYAESDPNADSHAVSSQENLPSFQSKRQVCLISNSALLQSLKLQAVYSSHGTEGTAKAPLPDELLTSVSSQPQKLVKREKVASSKGTSAPRKRNYDPDLFFKWRKQAVRSTKVISSDCTIYALKKIKLKGRDYATAYGFCQEIGYLKKLKGKTNIIQLIDYEVTYKCLLQEVLNGTMSNKDARVKDDGFIYIYMVLENGEIDLAHMLSQKWKEIEGSDRSMMKIGLGSIGRFLHNPSTCFCFRLQILQAVNTIHEERIVHSDLKPASFLLVGTLSYMSPEAFMCNESDENRNTIKCRRPSDIWSLGCILYQMVYGRTPFADYKTFWAKFKVITDPNHEITYNQLSNPWLVDLTKKCLDWDHNQRWRIPELLQHPFLALPIPPEPLVSSSIQLLSHIAISFGSDDRVSELCAQLQDQFLKEIKK